jgi:hypothetical protein
MKIPEEKNEDPTKDLEVPIPLTMYDSEKDEFLEEMLRCFSPAIEPRMRKAVSDYASKSTEELESEIDVSYALRLLKLSFWKEFNNHKISKRNFVHARVYHGIMTRQYYHNKIMHSPARMAWLMRPFPKYEDRASDIIDFGAKRLREALEAKLIYSNGHLDAKATKVILEIVQYFENRTKGRIAHQLNSTTKNFNANVNVNIETAPTDLKELDERLNNVQKQIAQYQGSYLIQDLPMRSVNVPEELEAEIIGEMTADEGTDQ